MNETFDPGAYVKAAPWTFAKTMADIPHSYTVRGQTPDADFEAMIRHIRADGFVAVWFSPSRKVRHANVYWEDGGHRYWTMGWPVGETEIINRERLPGSTLYDIRTLEALTSAPERTSGSA